MDKNYYVYIMGNNRPTLYIGVTNDILRRAYEHKHGLIAGFTKQHGLKKLLYFEEYISPDEAIVREKRLKQWNRSWKLELIRKNNPNLRDLYEDFVREKQIPAFAGMTAMREPPATRESNRDSL